MKRGQLTIYMITGIVIIALSFMLLYLKYFGSWNDNSDDLNQIAAQSGDLLPIRNYISSCQDVSAKDAAYALAERGGYYQLPTVYGEYAGLDYPFLFISPYDDPDMTITGTVLEYNYEQMVSDMVLDCVNRNPDGPVELPDDIILVDADIHPDNLRVSFHYDKKLELPGGAVVELGSFPSIWVPVRLGALHEASTQISKYLMQEPTLIPTYELDRIMTSLGDNATLKYYPINDTVLFIMNDPKNQSVNGRPLRFIFGAKYGI